MTIYQKPDEEIFASDAKVGEVQLFPNIPRGWGLTFEQTSGIPPMEWFNNLFQRIDQYKLYNLQRGLPEWSATLEYPVGAYVQYNNKTYRSLRQHTNQRPNVPSSSYWERWGFNLSEIGRATLTTFGLTQLTNDTGLDSETLALTAKAGKALSQRIAQNQQAIAGLNSGKVDKTAISNSVNSTSQTNVASSQAVKTAYDKGIEAKNAADAAQRTANDGVNKANNANTNANGRVSKAGDTMTGNLTLPYLRATGQYLSVTAQDSQFAGFDIIRQGNAGDWLARLEALPDKRWKFWTQNSHEIYLPARGGTVALTDEVDESKRLANNAQQTANIGVGLANGANTNANGRVSKAGDTMTGDLTVPYLKVQRNKAWVNIVSQADASASLDFSVLQDRTAQASVSCQDVSGYASELRFFATPPGPNYNTDRRYHVATIGHGGHIWAKPYGWLHDYFMRREDFVRSWYPDHYAGTEVYKIRHLGLMITIMNTTAGDREFILPEDYSGHAIVLATDKGGGRIRVEGNHFLGGNRIRIGGRSDTHCSVLVIGMKSF